MYLFFVNPLPIYKSSWNKINVLACTYDRSNNVLHLKFEKTCLTCKKKSHYQVIITFMDAFVPLYSIPQVFSFNPNVFKLTTFFWQMQTDLSPPCQDFRFLASCSNGTLSKLHSSPNQHFHNMVSSWQLKALWPAHSKKHHFCPSVRSLPVLNYFHDCRCGGESHRY